MGFNASNQKVYDLLNDKLYIVAPNQRKYVWTQNNWQELLDDISAVYNDNTSGHFIGSVVLKREKNADGIRNRFSIIDGQQRISTLTVLLSAMGLIFAENDEKEYFEGLKKPLFVNDKKNQPHPIVSKMANPYISKLVENLYFFSEQHFESNMPMISAEDLLKQSHTSKRISECFLFFYNWLIDTTGLQMELLSKYRDIIEDIGYIDIVADEDEDAYTIFEILNARGQMLTDFELLNNYLLKCASIEEKESRKEKLNEISSLLGKDIEVFLKHYALHKYGKKTDKGENRPYKIITRFERNNDKSQLIEDLVLKAKYYNKIITFDNCSSLEKKIFSFFKPRRQQQFRPIVLGLMHQQDLGTINQELYEKNLEFLYEFFVCYHVIGEQTSNKIEDIVYNYSSKIENSFSENVLIEFKASMIKRIPGEDSFQKSIKRLRYSHYWKAYSDSKKRENVSAIFEVIERELGYNGSFESCNVEHCLSDALSEEHSSIGNLMLIERAINEKCKDKPLSEKIELYKQSQLFLPQIVVKEYNETKNFDFSKRSEWISKQIYDYIIKIKE